jgi:putative SOS response-associated peptidase YedK
MLPLHDRMPVILHADTLEQWLDPGTAPGTLRRFLKPEPFSGMVRYPVGCAVNTTDPEGPALVEPAGDVIVL